MNTKEKTEIEQLKAQIRELKDQVTALTLIAQKNNTLLLQLPTKQELEKHMEKLSNKKEKKESGVGETLQELRKLIEQDTNEVLQNRTHIIDNGEGINTSHQLLMFMANELTSITDGDIQNLSPSNNHQALVEPTPEDEDDWPEE